MFVDLLDLQVGTAVVCICERFLKEGGGKTSVLGRFWEVAEKHV